MSKITENKLKQIINELKNTDASSLKEAARINNHNERYYYDLKARVKDSNISKSIIDSFKSICEKFSHSKENVETDDRAIIDVERDENGLIQFYTFEIFRKNNPTLRGKLSRAEMETIYRLYSIYGANLTQKVVSREFPQYTFVEFKRILRVWGVYKNDSEFPRHMLEEKTEEELEILHIKAKENNLLRKLEKNELRDTKNLLEKLYKENQELKQLSGKFEFSITNDVDPIYATDYIESNKDLVLYLSDIHVGACLESGALYDNNWNEVELKRRLEQVVENVKSFGRLNNLIICIVGDSLDGMDGMTARRDHVMPQNMDNWEQYQVFIDNMLKFIGNSIGLANYIKIYCVPTGNHGGDFERVANSALKYAIAAKFPEIEFTLFDKFFGTFTFKSHNWLLCHGK